MKEVLGGTAVQKESIVLTMAKGKKLKMPNHLKRMTRRAKTKEINLPKRMTRRVKMEKMTKRARIAKIGTEINHQKKTTKREERTRTKTEQEINLPQKMTRRPTEEGKNHQLKMIKERKTSRMRNHLQPKMMERKERNKKVLMIIDFCF